MFETTVRVWGGGIFKGHIISLLFHRILVARDFRGISKDVVRSLNCVSCSSIGKQGSRGPCVTSSSDILLPFKLLTSETELAHS